MTDIDHDILREYARARARVSPGEPLTLIEIGRERTTLVSGTDDTARGVIALNIGFMKTAKEFFQHNLPTPRKIEEAIAKIEDELARARTIVVNDSMLITTDKVMLEIARTAGIGSVSGPMLSIEVVEQLYQRLTVVTSGASTTQKENDFYAVHAGKILILREAMHHLGYAAIRVVT